MKRLFSKTKSGAAASNGGGSDPTKNLPKLHKYAFTGDLAKLNAALKKAGDVNVEDEVKRTPLHYAAEQGQEKAVLRLLELNATSRPDEVGKSPLILVSCCMLRLLCSLL